MKMKTKILASIFLLLLTNCVSQKEKQDSSPTTMDLLMKYKWKMLKPNADYYVNITYEYSENIEYIRLEITDHDTIQGGCPYYLSNRKVRRFNKKKVGISPNGKYIVTKIPYNTTVVCKIIEINDTMFTIQETKYGTITTFKAMPK